MIQSFKDDELRKFFEDEKVPRKVGWATLKQIVRRKLAAIDAAHSIEDLKAPPGNKLKQMKGNLAAFHSIRINDQWRIVFRWPTGAAGAFEVAVTDYH